MVPAAAQAVLKSSVLPKIIVAICLGVGLLLAALIGGARFGVLLPQARLMIEARTDGLKLGSLGKLKIEGLSGDIWHDFRIRRLTLRDDAGVWLEADNLHMQWRYAELLLRRFHADRIDAQAIHLIRRPKVEATHGKSSGLPVSFLIDEAHARIEMLPAFSVQRGVYDLDMMLIVRRSGGQRGVIQAASQLSPGDHLNLRFDIDKKRPLLILADAAEAHGGALAGALGLPADRPFLVQATAEGKTSAGRFTALAVSGADRPLEASGAWSPQGGQAQGRISLTASTLTRAFAGKLGPEVRFQAMGRQAPHDLYDLSLQATSQNLTVRASGLGDPGARKVGPAGLQVEASTQALSKITGGPAMGAARIAGVLTQPGDQAYRFKGQVSAANLASGGYALTALEGPVDFTHDGHGDSLTTQLAGRGGKGDGWVAAVLGASPKANLAGARTVDGRLSLKTLQVSGAGLKVDASGGRGLLGEMTFKGEADISNLAKAHAGAGGLARISWSAAQARTNAPWTFKADAAAEKLATGYPELDRLLGGKPKAALQAAWQSGRLSVAKANLDGAAFDASGAGVMADGKLSFKIGWTAQGPFRAGPVEITGKASGDGAITGSPSQPRADLTAQFAAIDMPQIPLRNARLTLTFQSQPNGSNGMIAANAESDYGPARARADFRFPEGGVDLTGLSVDAGGLKADGALSLRRNAPSAADLNVAAGPGAFLDAGHAGGVLKILDGPGGAQAQIALSGEGVRLKGNPLVVSRARISANGSLTHLPYEVQAQGVASAGRFALNGRGALAQEKAGYGLSFEGSGKLGARELRTLEPASFQFGGAERSAHLRLGASDGGRIAADGKLTDTAAHLEAQLTGVGLSLADEDLAGKVDARLTLNGEKDRLDGVMEAKLAGARGRGAPVASGVDSVVRGRLTDTALALDATASNAQGLTANASVTLPTEASAAPFRVAIARQQPMHGKFYADGEVRPLWDLLVGGERSLGGHARLQGELAGTLAAPQASGQASLAGGRFDDGATGLSLRDLSVQAAFAREAVDVSDVKAVDGHGGSADGSGRISLATNGVSSFRLNLHGFRLIDNDQATATASGQATIARAATGKVTLSGAFSIDRADVAAKLPNATSVVTMQVVEKNRPPELGLASGAPPPAGAAPATDGGWGLDVSLRAPGRIYLRGRGLNLELSLDAHVGGTTASPQLTGQAHVVRGDYDFAGKRFEFDDSSVVYLSTRPRDIRLNLSATRDDPTLTATVNIKGTAEKPEISFTSSPSLPNDEVLSQVLFGASASQLSPIEAAQLASAISAMASGGGLDVIGNLRSFARLDRLAFGGTEASGVTVSGGKYIRDNVYLELTGGGREGPTAEVEWRVRRQLSLISQVGGVSGARLSVRWRRDY